jgi:excinuclease ABC subunit C
VNPVLEATLAALPSRPGVYLMRDAAGAVLYVGKAQNLRSRVRSYWQKQAPASGPGEVQRIREVIDRVTDVEHTLTDSVSEALLLEANLIKRYQPRFNVRLKDDKSYPYIRITLGDDFPRVERTRRLVSDGSRYFGPYASASSVDEAMNLVRRLFPFRTCTIDIREGRRALARPCLLYHIKRCQGPCIEAVSKSAYRADIAQLELFLEGRQEAVVRELRREMETASANTEYERAAALRDKIRAIERTMEDQKMAAFARTELDALGLARSGSQAAVQVFAIRAGKLVGRDVYLLEAPPGAPEDEVLAGFVLQFYSRSAHVPPTILAAARPAEAPDLEAFLTERRGRRVRLVVPARGEKRRLVDLAERNAADSLAREQARRLADEGRAQAALEELARALDLPGPPLRIECYDISTVQGRATVGSMVVFEEGRPRTGAYRRFRIRDLAGQDDMASLAEVLRRRLHRVKAEEGSAEELRWALPDLIVVDGGRGQLAAACRALEETGFSDIPVVALAKEREELFVPGRADPLILPPTAPALYLVQRIRDEAHRFAVSYHRQLRRRTTVRSTFDDLPGVGPVKRGALLRTFGSAKRIREAPLEQLAAVPGIGPALAARIKAHLEVG